MNAIDILKAVRSARHTLCHIEQLALIHCPESPALTALTIVRGQVEATEEIIEKSLCPICDQEGHGAGSCPLVELEPLAKGTPCTHGIVFDCQACVAGAP